MMRSAVALELVDIGDARGVVGDGPKVSETMMRWGWRACRCRRGDDVEGERTSSLLSQNAGAERERVPMMA